MQGRLAAEGFSRASADVVAALNHVSIREENGLSIFLMLVLGVGAALVAHAAFLVPNAISPYRTAV